MGSRVIFLALLSSSLDLCLRPSAARRVQQATAHESREQYSWDEAIKALREGLVSTTDALDLVGLSTAHEGVEHISTILAFFEERKHLLLGGDDDDDDDDVTDVWEGDVSSRAETYKQALDKLQEIVGRGMVTLQDASSFATKQMLPEVEKRLLELPLENMQEKVEAFIDALATLTQLRNTCTGHRGDMAENVYARVWRLAEACLRPSKSMPRRALRALRKSAYEAAIDLQAKAAETTMMHLVCPAAASAARRLLLEESGEEENSNARLDFLLSILNNPTAPEACGEMYRSPEGHVSKTCMCEPGQCSSKLPTSPASEALEEKVDLEPWMCRPCGSGSCRLFWQREQCEDNTGCDPGAAPLRVVLGSKLATQSLLRRGLYVDPSCRGMTDCLKRVVGETRWHRLKGHAKTLFAMRRDWLAGAALATVSTKLVSHLAASGSSSWVQTNASSALEMPELPTAKQVQSFVGLIKPALLSYLWIRLRIQSVRERASAYGFCRQAAMQLSMLAAESVAAPSVASETISEEAYATQLSEVLAKSIPSREEGEERLQAAMLRPTLRAAVHEGGLTTASSLMRSSHGLLGPKFVPFASSRLLGIGPLAWAHPAVTWQPIVDPGSAETADDLLIAVD